jgi:hypothetical protein
VWRVFSRVTRVFQRRDKIFRARAFELFLRRLEVCDAGDDFFPLQSRVVQLFGHAHPFLILVPLPLADAIGARIGRRRCKIVIAVDKSAGVLVAHVPSR